MKKRWMDFIALGLVFCLLMSFSGCITFGGESPLISKAQARDVGDWSLEVIANGDVFGITDVADIQELLARDDVKMVLIDFWATWCSPASKSIDYLQEVYYLHKHHGLALLLINVDAKDDKLFPRIMSDIEKLEITAPVPWDYDSEVKQALDVGGIPSLLLVDKQGKIRYEYTGSISKDIDMPPLLDAVEHLFEELRRS